MKIKKFNEAYVPIVNEQYTVGDLKKLIESMSDDTPVAIINSAGRGTGSIKGNIMLLKDNIYYSESRNMYLQQDIPEDEELESSFRPVEKALCIFSD